MEPVKYIKGKDIVYVRNEFIYESLVYYKSEDYCCLMDSSYFASKEEIENLVEFYKFDSFLEQDTVLVCAPEQWLIDNGYKKLKPEYKYNMYNGKN